MDLVVDQVRELQHVDVANRCRLLELFAGHAVEHRRLARAGQAGCGQQRLDLRLACAVEHRGAEPDAALHAGGDADGLLVVEFQKLVERGGSGEARLEELADLAGLGHLRSGLGNLLAQVVRGPAEVRLEDLTDVHTRRHAERVEDDLDRRAVGQVGHVLLRQDARDDALVAVAAGHLVADRQLALHGDVDLDHLDDAGREFIALLHLADLLVGDLAQHIDLARGHLLDLVDLLVHARILVGVANALQVAGARCSSMVSRSRMSPLSSSFLLVRSSCRSARTSLPPRIASRRLRRSSVRMRISSARLRSSFSICSLSICLARSSFS